MSDSIETFPAPVFVAKGDLLESERAFEDLTTAEKIQRLGDELARNYGIVVNPERYKDSSESVSPDEERRELIRAALHVVLTEVAPKDSHRTIAGVTITFPQEGAIVPRADIYQPDVSTETQAYANSHHAIVAEVTERVLTPAGKTLEEVKQYILVPEIVVDGLDGSIIFADENDAVDANGEAIKHHTTFTVLEKTNY